MLSEMGAERMLASSPAAGSTRSDLRPWYVTAPSVVALPRTAVQPAVALSNELSNSGVAAGREDTSSRQKTSRRISKIIAIWQRVGGSSKMDGPRLAKLQPAAAGKAFAGLFSVHPARSGGYDSNRFGERTQFSSWPDRFAGREADLAGDGSSVPRE